MDVGANDAMSRASHPKEHTVNLEKSYIVLGILKRWDSLTQRVYKASSEDLQSWIKSLWYE